MKHKRIIFLLILTAMAGILFAAGKGVNLKVFPEQYTLTIDGTPVKLQKVTQYLKKITLPEGEHEFLFQSSGYLDKRVKFNITKRTSEIEVKLEKQNSMLEQITELSTGMHPKSVEFTPDGKYIGERTS